ncbi:hypothetical protein [Bosea sp. AAP35]|uniref:hypothetical protein n=1 Tax=Bosea sp. AAP35 TaxID=1523417 RepID=UPI0012E29353|nr:hypothetical protein [Bosea sp. AAP35]
MGPYLTLRERRDRKLANCRDAVEALKPVLAAYARALEEGIVLGAADPSAV